MKKPKIRAVLPSPSLVVAVVALVVAGTGTAVAAKFLVTSSKQIRNGAVTSADIKNGTVQAKDLSRGLKAQLDGKQTSSSVGVAGPQGPQGPAGPKGDLGSQGETGAKGETGAVGPSNAYTKTDSPGISLPVTVSQIDTLTLPAGKYVISAKAVVNNVSNLDPTAVTCQLQAGVNMDESTVGLDTPAELKKQTVSLQTVGQSATQQTVSLKCGDGSNGTAILETFRITATKVGDLAVQ